jgi:hypothetical protein
MTAAIEAAVFICVELPLLADLSRLTENICISAPDGSCRPKATCRN